MLRLHALGWGLKRIAREFGCSRNTVRRYVAADGWMAYRRRAGADLLFGFISQRYERRSLVVTTICRSRAGPKSSLTRPQPPRSSTASCATQRYCRPPATATGWPPRSGTADQPPARGKPADGSGSRAANAQRPQPAGDDDPRCQPRQHDRVLAGVQARHCARGADGLDAGCAHGHRQIMSDNPETLFIQEGDRLTG